LEKNIDLVTIGHALVDIRMVVDRFPHTDEESNVVKQSWAVLVFMIIVSLTYSGLVLSWLLGI